MQFITFLLIAGLIKLGKTDFSFDNLPPYGNCSKANYPPSSDLKVPTYIINLDLPPEQRWTKYVLDNKNELISVLNIIKNQTGAFFNGKLFALIEKFLPLFQKSLPQPYADEIAGIANATGLPLGDAVLYNLFYEFFTVCTSIITEDNDGSIYHVRNLDFGLFLGWDAQNHSWAITEALKPMVAILEFQKSGKTLYKATGFAGYVGILTAVKKDEFSLTVNERFKLNGGYIGILEWIMGDRSSTWMSFLTRQIMENVTSYNEAKQILSTTKLIAPVYFILGGKNSGEGCIITRDRASDTADVLEMTNNTDKWFLVQTNYDHWQKPPFFDDRLSSALKCMRKTSQQEISFSSLYDVLSTQPNLNKLTVYSSLMKVTGGEMEAYLQSCSDPCWPW